VRPQVDTRGNQAMNSQLASTCNQLKFAEPIVALRRNKSGCRANLSFASRLMAVLSMTAHWADSFVEGGIPFLAVAQTVGFDLGRSKMHYLSMGID